MAKRKKSSDKTEPKQKKRRPLWRRILRLLALIVVILCLLPFILTIVYRFEAVHPVSALMITNRLAGEPVSRHWVDIENVSKTLKYAVVMSEDSQFCNHHGIDLSELRAVVQAALEGESTRGASTITMQTAKNLFLWNDRSYLRKILEIPLAVWIDLIIPKKRIMEIYLNIAEWGPGIYGIDQAAGFHFGLHPNELNQRQGALLAVTLPNPAVRDPSRPSERLKRVTRIIERRARASGAYVQCLQ